MGRQIDRQELPRTDAVGYITSANTLAEADFEWSFKLSKFVEKENCSMQSLFLEYLH